MKTKKINNAFVSDGISSMAQKLFWNKPKAFIFKQNKTP